MPDGFDEFVFDPTTGATIRLPSAMAPRVGLPRPPGAQELDDAIRERSLRNQQSQQVDAVERALGEKAAFNYNEGLRWDPNGYGPKSQIRVEDEPTRVSLMGQTRDAAERALGPEGGNAYAEGMLDQFQGTGGAARGPMLASAPRDRAYIAQATGPVGTIGQIGEGLPGISGQVIGDMSGLSADLAAATQAQQDAAAMAMPPGGPVDPNRPELAGMDLQQQGMGLQERAAQQTGAADQRAATAEELAIADRNKALDRERDRAAAEEKRWQARRKEIEGKVTADTDAWANYKVDPGRRWKNMSTGRKIGAAISVAMTALGDALQRKQGPNLALDLITKSIEDDVNFQINERQHLGDVAQRSRTSIDDYRRNYGDWQSARALKLSEEYKRTADEIERIAAGQKSERAKANTLAMVGELRGRAGALEQGTAMNAWNREMKQSEFAEQKRHAKASEGLAWADHKQQADQFTETMKFNREKLAAEQKGAVDTYLAKSSAEDRKLLIENGIKDPSTRQYIMGDDGQPILERNATEGGKTQDALASAQTVLGTIDDIKGKIATDPGFAKLNPTQKQAALSTAMSGLALQLKEAYTLGTLDKGSVEFLDKFTGGDPTKITGGGLLGAIGVGATAGDNVTAKLDEIAKGVERKALNRLGNPKGFKFERVEVQPATEVNKAAETAQSVDATGLSAAEQAEPGWLSKGLQDTESLIFGTTQKYKKDQAAAEKNQSLKYPGFNASKEKDVDRLVKAAENGDTQARARLLDMVGNQKVKGLSDATMTIFESSDALRPMLPEALAKLPEDKRSYRQAIYAATQRGTNIKIPKSVPVTRPSHLTPEQDAYLETIPEWQRPGMRAAFERGI